MSPEHLLNTTAPPNPATWPQPARRAFILAAPVSLPLLALWWVVFLCIAAAAILIGMLSLVLAWAISPVIDAGLGFLAWISGLWGEGEPS